VATFETEQVEDLPDRFYVLVDGKFDVVIIRTVEGLVIDVYPKEWMEPIDTFTVWEDAVDALTAEAGG
jgi:hypothetical protein